MWFTTGQRNDKTCMYQQVHSLANPLKYLKYFAVSNWLQPPANSSWPTGAYHIWKMRATYHLFDGTLDWKRGWSMAYSIGNEAAWAIDHRSTSLFIHEWTKKLSKLSKNEIAEFLTENGRKKCKNTQKMLLDERYLLFEEYHQEIIGQSFQESLRRGKLVKKLAIFWTYQKTIMEFGFRII